MVPNVPTWQQKLFKNILKLDRGSSPRPIIDFMTEEDDGVNWIKIGDTKKGELYIDSTREKITLEGAKKSRKVSKGEIIVSNSMSYGQPYILNIDGYIHDGWFVIRNYEKYFNKEFLLQLLGSELIQRQYKRLAAGGVVSNISSDLVYAVRVSIPPLPEQRKIAKILSTWDKAIATTERLIANSQQQKKALMQQLLTGKKRLVNPDTGMVFEGDWEEVKLEQAVGKIYGGGTPSRNESYYWNGEIPWVTVKDLTSTTITDAQEHITLKGLQESSANIVPAGTVIIATRMALGKAVIATCDVAINQDLKAISSSERMTSCFLHYWFLYKADHIEKMGTGSTVKGVQISAIKSLPISLPCVQEQQKIASVLTAADKEIELLQAKLAHLKDEKKALMQQLLTGKRRVKVDVKEVA